MVNTVSSPTLLKVISYCLCVNVYMTDTLSILIIATRT